MTKRSATLCSVIVVIILAIYVIDTRLSPKVTNTTYERADINGASPVHREKVRRQELLKRASSKTDPHLDEPLNIKSVTTGIFSDKTDLSKSILSPASESVEEADAVALQPRKDLSTCVANVREIARLSKEWAQEHHSLLPKDFFEMANKLTNSYILICPSDNINPKPITTNISEFTLEMISYRIISPGAKINGVTKHFVVCPFHKSVVVMNDCNVLW